jgi:two-component system sensor histidine kinase and response regulator WspE
VLFAVPDGDGAWALAVEAVVGVLRLYVRPSDPRLQDNLPITGTAILPDGQVAVVMSAAEVSKRLRGMGQATGTALQVPGREPAPRPRVLLVEDSFTTRELERSVLTTEGFDVVQTTDGREALAVLAESEPGSFQLILTDVEMPRLDGIAMTRQVRDDPKWRNIPVVVLSHRDRDEDKRAGLEAGANAYFVKTDFRQRSFLAALHGLIG